MFEELLAALIESKAVSATKYVSKKSIIRATRTLFRTQRFGTGNVTVTLTIGRPNGREREFIKACVKVGEKFPIKKIQLRFISGKNRGQHVKPL